MSSLFKSTHGWLGLLQSVSSVMAKCHLKSPFPPCDVLPTFAMQILKIKLPQCCLWKETVTLHKSFGINNSFLCMQSVLDRNAKMLNPSTLQILYKVEESFSSCATFSLPRFTVTHLTVRVDVKVRLVKSSLLPISVQK